MEDPAFGTVQRLLAIRNNRREALRQYKEHGSWWQWVFEYVLLSKVAVVDPWNKLRYQDNLEKLRATGKMPPVRLCFHADEGIYHISDGIHRVAVARAEGYLKVPAVAAYERHYSP